MIGQPEVLLGIMPGGGGTQRLTRLIGTHRSLVAILEGKPFTLANGAVDEVVPPDEVVARATELAEHFGSRSKGSVAAIKKAVYFGGSKSLSEGLHVDRTEFLMADQSKDGQKLMRDYMETTDATGQLPLYNPDTYARALELGDVPGRRSTNGGELAMTAPQPSRTAGGVTRKSSGEEKTVAVDSSYKDAPTPPSPLVVWISPIASSARRLLSRSSPRSLGREPRQLDPRVVNGIAARHRVITVCCANALVPGHSDMMRYTTF